MRTTGQPAFVEADAGEARWWGESLAVIKAGAADTGGLMTIVEVTEPAGAEAPLHVHHNEDEAFWVLEGDVTFEVGGVRLPAAEGDYAFGPRGVPHRYSVGPSGCRMLFVLTPAGFEDLVRAMSVPASRRELPRAEDQQFPDPREMAAAARAHGAEVLDG